MPHQITLNTWFYCDLTIVDVDIDIDIALKMNTRSAIQVNFRNAYVVFLDTFYKVICVYLSLIRIQFYFK